MSLLVSGQGASVFSWFKWCHDDVIKWKYFPSHWPFVRRIHRSPVNSPHKGHWRRASMFPLICTWTYSWANNRDVGGLRCHCDNCDVIVIVIVSLQTPGSFNAIQSFNTSWESKSPQLPRHCVVQLLTWISPCGEAEKRTPGASTTHRRTVIPLKGPVMRKSCPFMMSS